MIDNKLSINVIQFYWFTVSVASYRLVYSIYPSDIINEDGEIPTSAVSVLKSDIVEGSLDPLLPYLRHIVTIKLIRESSPPTMYFTINSKSSTGNRVF